MNKEIELLAQTVKDEAEKGVNKVKDMADANKLSQNKPSSGKQWLLALTILFTAAASVLSDYVSASFSTSIFLNAGYWINLVATQVMLTMLVLISNAFKKDHERGQNDHIKKLSEKIGSAYERIENNGQSGMFDSYIAAENYRRKLKAYKNMLRRLIKTEKDGKKKLQLTERLASAESEITYTNWIGAKRIRFYKVCKGTLFSEMNDTKADDENFSAEEGKATLGMFKTRVVWLLLIGVLMPMVMFDDMGFSVGYLFKTAVKIVQIFIAVWTGTGSGKQFIAGTLVSKMRNRLSFINGFFEKVQTNTLDAFIKENSPPAAAHGN